MIGKNIIVIQPLNANQLLLFGLAGWSWIWARQISLGRRLGTDAWKCFLYGENILIPLTLAPYDL